MLSRTADSLFWLARYVERAENMSRLIDMGRRRAATPDEQAGSRADWPAVLSAAGCAPEDEQLDSAGAIRRLVLDRENQSSVLACFENARGNARAARAALTKEMWEAVNDAWIAVRALTPADLSNGALSGRLDWIKQVGANFRGAAHGSALRNDGYEFLRLGASVERLDSGARMIDVICFADAEAGAPDDLRWVSALRAAGVLRAYHAACRGDHDPRRIAKFLIFDERCPRSLAYCAYASLSRLRKLAEFYGKSTPALEEAQALHGELRALAIEDVFGGDLHGFVSSVIRRNNALSLAIAESFHFAPKSYTPSASDSASTAAPRKRVTRPTALNGAVAAAPAGAAGVSENRSSSASP